MLRYIHDFKAITLKRRNILTVKASIPATRQTNAILTSVLLLIITIIIIIITVHYFSLYYTTYVIRYYYQLAQSTASK